MISKTEDRLRGLVERGWRPRIETHLLGRRAMQNHGMGDKPWVEHSPRWLVGWLIYMLPGEALYKRGATARNGGVYATLDECLTEAEIFADRESTRLEAK
jgi:hypothetical protein